MPLTAYRSASSNKGRLVNGSTRSAMSRTRCASPLVRLMLHKANTPQQEVVAVDYKAAIEVSIRVRDGRDFRGAPVGL